MPVPLGLQAACFHLPWQVPAHSKTCFPKKGAWNPGSVPCPWGRPPPCALRVAARSTSPHLRLPARLHPHLSQDQTQFSLLGVNFRPRAASLCLLGKALHAWGWIMLLFPKASLELWRLWCGLHNSKAGGPLQSLPRSRSANHKSVCLNLYQ